MSSPQQHGPHGRSHLVLQRPLRARALMPLWHTREKARAHMQRRPGSSISAARTSSSSVRAPGGAILSDQIQTRTATPSTEAAYAACSEPRRRPRTPPPCQRASSSTRSLCTHAALSAASPEQRRRAKRAVRNGGRSGARSGRPPLTRGRASHWPQSRVSARCGPSRVLTWWRRPCWSPPQAPPAGRCFLPRPDPKSNPVADWSPGF